MIREPMYDNDVATKEYVDKQLKKEVNTSLTNYSKNWGTTPVPPYHVNDTWTINGEIYVCIKERLIGEFNTLDWKKVIDTSVYDEYIANTFKVTTDMLAIQTDDKIETYVQSEDPSTSWVTSLDKDKHVYDCWRKSTTNSTDEFVYQKINTNPISYGWVKQKVSANMFDFTDGYKCIYKSIPSVYNIHDLWLIEDGIDESSLPNGCVSGTWVVCITSNTTYNKSDWTKYESTLTMESIEEHFYTKTEVDNTVTTLNNTINAGLISTKNSILQEVSSTYATQEVTNSIINDINDQQAIIGNVVDTQTQQTEQISSIQTDLGGVTTQVSTLETTVDETFQEFRDNLGENYYSKSQTNTVIGSIVEQNNNSIQSTITEQVTRIDADLVDIKSKQSQLTQTTNGLTQIVSNTGGNNLLRNSYFKEFENGELTYWIGTHKVVTLADSKSGTALSLQNGKVRQSVNLVDGEYCFSCKYKRTNEVGISKLIINNDTYVLEGAVDEICTISKVINLTTDSITIEFESDINDGCIIYEPMLNEGNVSSIFTQNASESISDTVTIGKGIEVKASNINNKTSLNADGMRGRNIYTDELTFYQTVDGMYGKRIETESLRSGDLIISSSNGHNTITGL